MYEYERNQAYTADAGSLNAYMTKVFLNMAVGLGLTALVAFLGYYSVMTGGIFYTILVSKRKVYNNHYSGMHRIRILRQSNE